MSLRVNCPSCQQPCQVPADVAGRSVRCPSCKQAFTVRTSAGPASRLLLGWATSTGRLRDRNEDSLFVQHIGWAGHHGGMEAAVAFVADGMGGHDAGDKASAVSVAAVAKTLAPRLAGLVAGAEPFENNEAMLDELDRSLWEANRAVANAAEQESGCTGMGATGVAALIVGPSAAICHVGDCRAYLWRAGKLELKTRDQTLVMRMVDLGMLTEREARNHRAASEVTQALGRQYELEPSRLLLDLLKGDRLVLACDGLHAHLEIADIANLIKPETPAPELAARLVRAADDAGGSDNCTVIVLCAE